MKTKILTTCLNIALKNNNPLKHPEWESYKHFSFVIQNGKIVEWGTNRKGSSISYLGYLPYQKIHSEVDAYSKARGIMDKRYSFDIINIRLGKKNQLLPSSPCKCCSAYLRHLGCKSIWFSTNIENFACVKF